MKTISKEMQESLIPTQALTLLKEGNSRFINNLKFNRNLLQQANETSDGQHPFAVILSCIDSRTSAELIFDQGLGDIFSVRIAGNIINDDILGSMEFSCKLAGSKIIVVLGHSNCGAIKGACDNVEMGNLTGLLHKIQPAIESTNCEGNRTSNNVDFVNQVTEKNVVNNVRSIVESSPILKEMLDKEEVGIIGGVHNIETGEVIFIEESGININS